MQNRRRPAAKGQKASRRQKGFRRIELKPGENNCCRRPAATVPRRRRGQGRPLGQQGGAPDPLPSKDGSPQQQSRQATGQRADNENYECIICQATRLRQGGSMSWSYVPPARVEGHRDSGQRTFIPPTLGVGRACWSNRSLQNCSRVLPLE